MSLDKAKAALEEAAKISSHLHGLTPQGLALPENKELAKDYIELTTIASIQAQVAQAEALTRIADALEPLTHRGSLSIVVDNPKDFH